MKQHLRQLRTTTNNKASSSKSSKHLLRSKKKTTTKHKRNFNTTNRSFSTTVNNSTIIHPLREVTRIEEAKLQPEGTGAQVKRSIYDGKTVFSPFALLDEFHLESGSVDRGSGFFPHEHRGIQTITFLETGAVEHRDHKGHQGQLYAGGVQYMSAGKGIVHSEMPITNKPIDGLQLWVNLPQTEKLSEPAYQQVSDLPIVHSEDNQISARIIMGHAFGEKGPIIPKTPVHYVIYNIQPDATLNHTIPAHWNAFVYVIEGEAEVLSASSTNSTTIVDSSKTIYFERQPGPIYDDSSGCMLESTIQIKAYGCKLLKLAFAAGQPHDGESGVAVKGAMIMNTKEEIIQAFTDVRKNQNGFEGRAEFIKEWKVPTAYADQNITSNI